MTTILYVEDNPVVASSTIRFLRRQGVEVFHVATLAAGLAALDERSYAAVLTDWNLGGGETGEPVAEVCEARGVPFRVFSAELTPEKRWRHVWVAKWRLSGLQEFVREVKEGAQ